MFGVWWCEECIVSTRCKNVEGLKEAIVEACKDIELTKYKNYNVASLVDSWNGIYVKESDTNY